MIEAIVLTNARVVMRDRMFVGTVEVLGEHIVAAYRGSTRLQGAHDLGGDYLLAGLVELHTDNLERYLAPRPGVRWPALPAVLAHDAEIIASGITTVFDALTLGDIVQGAERPEEVRTTIEGIRNASARKMTRACHFLHLRCEISYEDVLGLFEPYAHDRMVRLVSVMDHAPGQRQFVNEDKYREWYQGRYGFSGAEMAMLMDGHRQASRSVSECHRRRIVAVSRERKLPLASHDDATVEHVSEAAEDGCVVSEFPTTEAAARAAREHGIKVLMGAPNVLQGRSHSGNVAALDLAMAGLLDILSSDYYPASLLQAAFRLHGPPARLPIAEAIATVTVNPAEACGLADRGEIAPGKRADLLRVACTDDLPLVRQVWRGGERVF